MADRNSDILFDSVRFVLSNWPVLKLAVEHGFGGSDSGEKAEWLVSIVDQVLRENGKHFLTFDVSLSLNLVILFCNISLNFHDVYPRYTRINAFFSLFAVSEAILEYPSTLSHCLVCLLLIQDQENVCVN